MDLERLKPGKYVLAVSGGVDSVVLLDMLAKQKGLRLVVAHFDHGMRSDSAKDKQLVEKLANKYRLKFVSHQVKLGIKASEAAARKARYEFLEDIKKEEYCNAIITAHHQDDVVETMIINLIRGTSWRGLTTLQNTENIKRPLLSWTKADLLDYARKNNLYWRDDPTNQDASIFRNYIRLKLIPTAQKKDKDFVNKLLKIRSKLKTIAPEIEEQSLQVSEAVSNTQNGVIVIDRSKFILLPPPVASAVAVTLVKSLPGTHELNKNKIRRLVNFIKTAQYGKTTQVSGNIDLSCTRLEAILTSRQSSDDNQEKV